MEGFFKIAASEICHRIKNYAYYYRFKLKLFYLIIYIKLDCKPTCKKCVSETQCTECFEGFTGVDCSEIITTNPKECPVG